MSDGDEDALEALTGVGPVTASVLDAAGITPGDIRDRAVTFATLTAIGVNPGVAARIRRRYSLPWSSTADGEGLDRRAEQIRGLDAAERDWVAASTTDWTTSLEEYSPEETESTESEEVTIEKTPVTAITGVGPKRARALAEAGITSVRALAAADPAKVAQVLELDEARVTQWHADAVERQK